MLQLINHDVSNFLWSSIPSDFLPGLLAAIIFAGLMFGIVQTRKIEYVVYFFMVWFPIESLVLNVVPIGLYNFFKYVPEVILYSVLIFLYVKNRHKHRYGLIPSSLRLPFFLFGAVAVLSLLFNWYDPTIWLLGVRQMIRFVAVFLIILLAQFGTKERTTIIRLALAVVLFEVIFGLVQFGLGGRLDRWLFPREVTIGNLAVLGGNDFFWTPGSRIFATMGRYDQLGSFIMVGLLLALPWLYSKNKEKLLRYGLYGAFGFGALILTSSRASWLGVLAGIIAVGYGLMRDKKIFQIIGFGAAVLAVYLISFMLTHDNITNITEKSNQTLAERILEAGSLAGWRESYNGYGRIFFIVNTPLMVVADSPLVGVGPGNYGGGVAAALLNSREYDRLHLPFGVQNTYGQIDNSWFSLWGELGTLGLAVVVWIMVCLGRAAARVYRSSQDERTRMLAASFFGITVAVSVVGFFGPYLEFRTLMFYFWVLAGLVFVAAGHEKDKNNFLVK